MQKKLISLLAVLGTVLLVGFGLVWAQRPAWLPAPIAPSGQAEREGLPVVDAPPPSGFPVALSDDPRGPSFRGFRSRLDPATGAATPGRAGEGDEREEGSLLRARLLDPKDATRLAAVLATEETSEGGRNLDYLLRQVALFDPNPRIRAAAIEALDRRGATEELAEIAQEAADDEAALDALLDLDRLDPQALIPLFNSPDPELWEAAMERLYEITDPTGAPDSAAVAALWSIAQGVQGSQDFDRAEYAAQILDFLDVDGAPELLEFVQLMRDQADAPYWRQKAQELQARRAAEPACQSGDIEACNRAIVLNF